MNKIIQPFVYKGIIDAPKSKSYLQRAIAIACLAEKPVSIIGYTASNDALAAISIARSLGAVITLSENELLIEPNINKRTIPTEIHCGEAGLSTRMFSPIAAVLSDQVIVQGEGSILTRPMNMIIEALEQLGCKVDSNNYHLPLTITRHPTPGEISIDGSESSQLLTGLLIALPALKDESIIHVKNLKSIPYVQMTLDILSAFNVHIEHQEFKTFRILGNQMPQTKIYHIEGDWSGASFHLVGGAISGEITLTGLNPNSAQADRAILEALRLSGAQVILEKNQVKVSKKELKSFHFDATNCPDLFPPLAALAASCEGQSIITGTSRLTHKESDRALTIQEELAKLGITIELQGNNMIITGGQINGGTASSRNDHRIAMMLGTLASVSNAPIEIEDPMAINKSYPKYYEDLEQINR